MSKSLLVRGVVLTFSLLVLFCLVSIPTVGASGIAPQGAIHGTHLLSAPHTVVASIPVTLKAKPDGTVHPADALCTYIVYQPFIALVSGLYYIIAEGGFTCNNTFSEAQAMISLKGPTTSSLAVVTFYDTCDIQTYCEGYVGIPYQSGGTWQSQILGGGRGVGFVGQGNSSWVSL